MATRSLFRWSPPIAGAEQPPAPPTNARPRDLSAIGAVALADELRVYTVRYWLSPTSSEEVHPWGGDTGEDASLLTAKRFTFANRLVRAGVVSDWPRQPEAVGAP